MDKNFFYIVTEFCSGGELFDRIVKAGSLSEKKAAKVMTQILLAINYCHKNKIVHRDLKPENILYESSDENSSLKIIDFGTSTLLNSGKILKEHVGTVHFSHLLLYIYISIISSPITLLLRSSRVSMT